MTSEAKAMSRGRWETPGPAGRKDNGEDLRGAVSKSTTLCDFASKVTAAKPPGTGMGSTFLRSRSAKRDARLTYTLSPPQKNPMSPDPPPVLALPTFTDWAGAWKGGFVHSALGSTIGTHSYICMQTDAVAVRAIKILFPAAERARATYQRSFGTFCSKCVHKKGVSANRGWNFRSQARCVCFCLGRCAVL